MKYFYTYYLKAFIPIVTAGIGGYISYQAAPPILEGSNSALDPAMDLGNLTSDSNIGELVTNGGIPTIEKMIISPFENWALLLSPITDYIENLSREQLLGLSFLLYIGVVIWCFSWILVYSYLSRKTIDWGEKYGHNQLVVLIMNIIRYSSVGLGYIYICTIYLCLGLSGGLAYYIFING